MAEQLPLALWMAGSYPNNKLTIDQAVAERWGRLCAKAEPRSPLPVIDGLLAATALHHNLTLVTRNTKDLEVTGATLFNPWVA